MPIVSVNKDELLSRINKQMSQQEFEELCFAMGTELDDVTTEDAIKRKQNHLDDEPHEGEGIIYKIEIAANRYDLLCTEGLCRAIRIFLGKEKVPVFTLSSPKSVQTMTIKPETATIRPFVVCAILRNIKLDQTRYNSLIDLQEKLHQNICRKRTLVAIGTHDLDTLEGPFTYEALPPSEIKFVPLKQTREFTATELMEFYKSDLKLKKFLHIIEDSSVYPVIFDNKKRVLSLPPIINGAHSAITLNTKNIFIECTATDLTKAKIVLNTLVSMFSEYCENKFEIEPVDVVDASGKRTRYPDLSLRQMEVDLSYISKAIGVPLEAAQVADLLTKMQLTAKESTGGKKNLQVSIPVTRSDVLHPCDVMEDVAIAYGYNNIPKTFPKPCTYGKQQPLNERTEELRIELANAGYMEVLNWILIAEEENSKMLNRKEDPNAVVVSNPRSREFEACRASLLPGILKVMEHSKDVPRPIQIFEIGDVVRVDTNDVGASNFRNLGALYSGSQKADLQIVHGLLDRIMIKLGANYKEGEAQIEDLKLYRSEEPEFLEDHQAKIFYKDCCIGSLGVIHPQVLKNFDITFPCSYLELELEVIFPLVE